MRMHSQAFNLACPLKANNLASINNQKIAAKSTKTDNSPKRSARQLKRDHARVEAAIHNMHRVTLRQTGMRCCWEASLKLSMPQCQSKQTADSNCCRSKLPHGLATCFCTREQPWLQCWLTAALARARTAVPHLVRVHVLPQLWCVGTSAA